MHEMGIAQNILEIALEAANRESAAKISRIDIVSGELRGIVPLQLTFCFGIVAQNTIASSAYLNIEETPVTAHCDECGEDFKVEEYQYLCPKCSSANVKVTGGSELRVKDIEIE
ncbi:MAG: hydrogenase maturation nickel metallochaperone HypA [Dehalococcoidia bacterium]|nr:hydrogenase maturation nickel metallochaperone HypA [Dehalococcoidia bacterium]